MEKIVLLIIALAFTSNILLSQDCLEERHSTNITDSWVSCQMNANPYIPTGNTHWILYNFTSAENLFESTIWNINHPDYLDYGVKSIQINYSLDKTNWNYWGVFNIAQGTARSDYLGVAGPDFNGLSAKHILITVLHTYGDLSCAGFSEIKINTESADCPNEIVFDEYDHITGAESHQAKSIIAYNTIHNEGDAILFANNTIQLSPGFEIELGSILNAYITACD